MKAFFALEKPDDCLEQNRVRQIKRVFQKTVYNVRGMTEKNLYLGQLDFPDLMGENSGSTRLFVTTVVVEVNVVVSRLAGPSSNPDQISFLFEIFLGFSLNYKTSVRKFRPHLSLDTIRHK